MATSYCCGSRRYSFQRFVQQVAAYGIEYSLTSGYTGTGNTGCVPTSGSGTGFYSEIFPALLPATTVIIMLPILPMQEELLLWRSAVIYHCHTIFTATTLDPFGDVLVTNTTTDAKTFTISSTGLNATNVTVGPLFTGYSFSLITQPGHYSV